ncbi:hypothetical protein COB21_05055 [Candidatus Aerophobetes bacterium]|uniref:Iron dependent repressor metal binding and dimerisation domain-containing protein n=1 Tax=Aerophobetes bacterium TaxID=2030807 RepID=A0A2A4X1J4_UNCAE|nr:MAG: hypothetical protein COB21_05055 [Candidatus Aerophobetes bacterium]
MFSWIDLVTHPLLIASTLATLFMSIACAMLGGLLFVKKSSLLGETLSHAAYPGVVLGLIVSLVLGLEATNAQFICMLLIGTAFVFLGDRLVKKIEKSPLYFSDMALSVVLALFFSLGVLLSSIVQYKWPSHFSAVPMFLFGQLATLTDLHAMVAALFLVVTLIWLVFNYRQIELVLFDRAFASNMGISSRKFEMVLTLLISLSIVIGVRSLGIVLISGMLIAPAIGARILSKKLGIFIAWCAVLALLSTLIGIYYALNLPTMIGGSFARVSLPTGPIVLLSSSLLSCICLIAAPNRGLVGRLWRGAVFNWKCGEENVLKTVWKAEKQDSWSFSSLRKKIAISSLHLMAFLISLRVKRKITFSLFGGLTLTKLGAQQALNIVRVHRLWELYLFSCLGVGEDKVHGIAEQVEHVSIGELEKKLTLILKNPLKDPHDQPIPCAEVLDESL